MSVIYEPKGMAREYSALACNLYAGCQHGCTYCYAPGAVRRNREEFHADVAPRKDIIDRLRKDAKKFADTTDRVLLCFTSDPYQPCEREHGITREALKIFADHHIPVQVLTKGGGLAARDFDILAACDGVFATTLCFSQDKWPWRKKWEPNAAPVLDRINAIAEAHRLGIPTWVSIEPVIDPAQAIWLIDHLSETVDEWRVGKLNHHPLANEIDWKKFAADVSSALQASGRSYMIKDALAAYLPKGTPTRYQVKPKATGTGLFRWTPEAGAAAITAT